MERETGFIFPPDLREIYLDYPFSPTCFAGELAMPNDGDCILEACSGDLVEACFGGDRRRFLEIGTDGSESAYFAERVGDGTKFHEVSQESREVLTSWDDVGAWFRYLETEQAEIDELTTRLRNRPWWKFWSG